MILTVIGARPQFIKAAVLSNEFKKAGIEEEIIHTGQHYDYKMSEVFFRDLGLKGVTHNLNIGSANHGIQTGEMLIAIENVILKKNKNIKAILLYGDTNSTLAGAIVASKLQIPIIHVEAGLRSFNRSMPEEINRIITDHLSSLLFCSSEEGKKKLQLEGITEGVFISGDIMLDAFKIYSKIAAKTLEISNFIPPDISKNFCLLTIHRPANTDDINKLQEIIDALSELPYSIVWPVHPRNKEALKKLRIPKNISLFEPFSYFEMMLILKKAKKVITDSGGLQKESYWAKKPCITIRPETEWVETLNNNWNILTSIDKGEIRNAVNYEVDVNSWAPLYGDGDAASIILEKIKKTFNC